MLATLYQEQVYHEHQLVAHTAMIDCGLVVLPGLAEIHCLGCRRAIR